MSVRIEKDSMGPVEVPQDKYWGAQTQRSVNNFKIGTKHYSMNALYIYLEGLIGSFHSS